MVAQRIGLVSLVVDDHDDALAFFVGKLGFSLVEDALVPYKTNGIVFVREPKREPYGKVAVFKDLYGNLWDLLEPSDANRSA